MHATENWGPSPLSPPKAPAQTGSSEETGQATRAAGKGKANAVAVGQFNRKENSFPNMAIGQALSSIQAGIPNTDPTATLEEASFAFEGELRAKGVNR